jgi:uncharacterized protein (TIGR02996 family)
MHSSSLHQSLEAELAANPDDLATHAAYADLLSEEGDARGEFIQAQIALEDPTLDTPQRLELRQREQQLLSSYHERWLGGLAPYCQRSIGAYQFRRGWLDTLDITRLDLRLARTLRDAPEARLLRDLAIGFIPSESHEEVHPDDGVPEEDSRPGLWPLVGSPNLANVRFLRIGQDQGDNAEDYNCHLVSAAIPLLLRGMPRLEEVRLFARGYDLSALFTLPTLKNLRVLQVNHCTGVYRLDLLANNPAFHHLTHLLCHPHALAWHDNRQQDEAAGFHPDEGYLPLAVVRPLLDSLADRPYLTHLRLRCSSMGDEGCSAIVQSGALKRLKVLDLRHGRISDAGAAILASCSDIRNLELLDLGANLISEEGAPLLLSLPIAVNVEAQHEADYEYLHEGDIE